MQLDSYCIECLIARQMGLIRCQPSGEKKLAYIKEAMDALVQAPPTVAAPYMVWKFDQMMERYWDPVDHYSDIKQRSNDFMLSRLGAIRQAIAESSSPLRLALQYAQTGNYIDFAASSHQVTEEKLDALLADSANNFLDEMTFAIFQKDLQTAKKLVYLGDNAGELVADMTLLEELKRQYPALDMTFVVRGGNVINDVTREDATYVGMDKIATIVDNGLPIPGTELSMISQELQAALDASDMVISKGQGNFETFCPNRYNTYYMFLCKCERFQKMFNVPAMHPMFCTESTMPPFEALC